MADYSFLIDSMTWSYSRLQSFEKCPYGFFVHYILGEEEDPTFLASYGSFVHKIHQLVLTGALPKEDAAVYYLEHFRDEVRGTPPTPKVAKSYLRDGYEYMSAFPDFGKVLGVEKELEFEIEGFRFQGIADLIVEENGLVVVDHKAKVLAPFSGRKKPTKTDLELLSYLRQLYLYADGIAQEYGEYPKELVFNCYRERRLVRTPFDPEQLEITKAWAVDLIQKIRSGQDWVPDMDFFKCHNLCGLNDRCDYYELM